MLTYLLAALLLVLVWATPAPAAIDYRAAADAAGLPAELDLYVMEDETGLNGAFWWGGHLCEGIFCMHVDPFVAVVTPPGFPQEWTLAIILHEVGHYHQWQAGDLVQDNYLTEWNADVYAARELCRQGYNGPELVAGVLGAIWAKVGDRPSLSHGVLSYRVRHAAAVRCGPGAEARSAP